MAASPATSSAAARPSSSYPRLSNAPLSAPRAAAVSFPSSPSPRQTALVADARASRRPVVAATAAGHQRLMGSLTDTEGLRFGVVVARFNEIVTYLLLQGALETFERYSIKEENITVVSVPGSFEIPIAAQKLGKSGNFDAIICFGAVIRGDTTHYDAVANSAASGVLNAGLSAGQRPPRSVELFVGITRGGTFLGELIIFFNVATGVPCIFGVLTCDDMDQALNRAGGKAGNKGAEAALTAIEMASLFRHHLG